MKYELEIYLPGNSGYDAGAHIESDRPFLAIQRGDIINPRTFTAHYASNWESYVKQGRGVVVDNTDRQKPNKTGIKFENLRYRTDVSSTKFLRLYNMDVQAMVNTYDPETSAVVFITREYNDLARIIHVNEKGFMSITP